VKRGGEGLKEKWTARGRELSILVARGAVRIREGGTGGKSRRM